MTTRDHLLFYLNGKPLQVRGKDAFLTLSDFLRERMALTGTKIVCSEGDCGACTVLVGWPSSNNGIEYKGIDSCILFMHQLDGAHVVSVEGLSPQSAQGKLHPVQQAMVDCFGSQCGFCTPGFVGAMVAKMESLPEDANGDSVSWDDWKLALTGNLCRCTGYVQILEAAAACADAGGRSRIETLYPSSAFASELRQTAAETVHLCAPPRYGSDQPREMLLPATLEEALAFKSSQPAARIINGATDIGVLTNKGRVTPGVVLSLTKIGGHSAIAAVEDNIVRIGMRATWADVESWAREALPAFYDIVIRFGSPQIRAAGTLVGNVGNGSPIGDSLPLLVVMEAELELANAAGSRRVSVTDFYRGYKDFDLKADELITAVHLPMPDAQETLRLYKVSKRNDLDISTFTAAIRMTIDGQNIVEPRIAYGGVGPTVVRLPKTESFLNGKSMDESTFREAGTIAREEITPISDVRGTADYRFQLAENILQKFYYEVAEQVMV